MSRRKRAPSCRATLLQKLKMPFRVTPLAMRSLQATSDHWFKPDEKRMKLILRERTTGLWLKPCGRWEPNSVNARQFATSAEAIQCSIELHFPNVDICIVRDSVATENGGRDEAQCQSFYAA